MYLLQMILQLIRVRRIILKMFLNQLKNYQKAKYYMKDYGLIKLQIDSIDDPAFIPENDENSTNDDTLELDFSTSDIAERDRNRELEELLQAWSITSMEMSNRNS